VPRCWSSACRPGGREAADQPAPPYQFTVRAAPVENYLQYFRELVQGVGFSRVQGRIAPVR